MSAELIKHCFKEWNLFPEAKIPQVIIGSNHFLFVFLGFAFNDDIPSVHVLNRGVDGSRNWRGGGVLVSWGREHHHIGRMEYKVEWSREGCGRASYHLLLFTFPFLLSFFDLYLPFLFPHCSKRGRGMVRAPYNYLRIPMTQLLNVSSLMQF